MLEESGDIWSKYGKGQIVFTTNAIVKKNGRM